MGFPILANGKVVAICEFFLEEEIEATNLLKLLQVLGKQLGGALEKRAVEKDLKITESWNRLLLQSSAEGIYGVDTNGITTFVNHAAASITGYEASELIGKAMHEMLHHRLQNDNDYPPTQSPVYAAYCKGESHRVADEVMWRKDGTSIPVEYASSPIFNNETLIGAVVVFSDITERKKIRGTATCLCA